MSIIDTNTFNQLDERTRANYIDLGNGTYEEDPLLRLYDDEEELVEVRLSEVTDWDWDGKEQGISIYQSEWVDVTTETHYLTYWFNTEDTDMVEEDVTGEIIIQAIEAH